MRILHTSDWHLGRLFYELHLTADQEEVLNQLCTYIEQSRPEVVVLAGDVYDRSAPPEEAVRLFESFLVRMVRLQIPVIVSAGNHDSGARVEYGRQLFRDQGIHVIGSLDPDLTPITLTDAHGEVDFYVLPYFHPADVRAAFGVDHVHTQDEAFAYVTNGIRTRLRPGSRSVLVAHGFITGGSASESERPLSVGGSSEVDVSHFHGFHYVALGHLHRPQSFGHVRYSGSLMKYSFDEVDHHKSVTMVDLGAQGELITETVPLTPQRDVRSLQGRLDELLAHAADDPAREDYLQFVLTDEGALLDPMAKLRKVYPHAMNIRRQQSVVTASHLERGSADVRQMSEMGIFESFVRQIVAAEISDEQKEAFAQVVSEYYDGLRKE